MTKPVTVRERVRELVQQHGSYRKAAEATGVSVGSLYAINTGKSDETNLHVSTIRGLGLKCGPKFDRA